VRALNTRLAKVMQGGDEESNCRCTAHAEAAMSEMMSLASSLRISLQPAGLRIALGFKEISPSACDCIGDCERELSHILSASLRVYVNSGSKVRHDTHRKHFRFLCFRSGP